MNLRDRVIQSIEQMNRFRFAEWEPREYDEVTARADVNNTIIRKYPRNSFSELMLNQLTALQGCGVVEICGNYHPYELFDVYLTVDQIVTKKKILKPFTKSNSKLRNLSIFHSHHSRAFYIGMNCLRFFKKHFRNDEEILAKLAGIKDEYPDRNDHMSIFLNTVLMDSNNWDKKTGEWIVYQKINDSTHFLCLYVHDNDDSNDSKLYELIEEHLIRT